LRLTGRKRKKTLLRAAVTVLIYAFKFLFLIKGLITAFFIYAAQAAGYLLRPLFLRTIVKAYYYYVLLLKKLGWHKFKNNFLTHALNQKLVHILVVGISITLVFFNITQKTQADDWSGNTDNIILKDLVKGEFDELDSEEERLVVESFDREAVISATQQSYFDNLSTVKIQPRAKMGPGADETDEEDLAATIMDDASLVKPDLAETKITKRLRPETITYVVEPGDTISTIAENFEISVNTILWENNLSAYSIIRPEDQLAILPMTGVSHKVTKGETLGSIAKKYEVEEEKIVEFNDLAEDSVLQPDRKLLIPGGRGVTRSYEPPAYSGLSALKDLVKAPGAKPVSGNKMNWPTEGRRITQYYSWRHHAMDVANKKGTPIYAADAGVVEYIGWGTGYGNQIIIDHGGGKKTRYAHLSKFSVDKGQTVDKGETIAAMGSTGWSTGPHLHFEVIINGVKQNPLNYVK
jgi:murein DD-endopeptidase MepM/ murein hydrolase activator NlpD